MEQSPKGRTIEEVEGQPDAIQERGAAIKSLGDQMLDAAGELERIKTRGVGDDSQKGKAITKLKDSIDDSYVRLRQAGELYQPVGPVIEKYGIGLRTAQAKIKEYVGEAQSRWATYQSLPGDVDPRGSGGLFEPEEGSEEAKKNKEEDDAKKAAYEEWLESADKFDFWYGSPGNEDSWESIFDDAVNGISSEMSGKIKDSFWSTLGDFLSIAALVLGIVALFVGGWVIAVIAIAVGAAFVFVTIMQYVNGEKSLTDIAFAALGILPIGKLSNLAKLAHGGRGLKAFGNGAIGQFKNLKRANGLQRLGGKFFKEKAFTFNFKGGLVKGLLGSEGPKAVKREHMKLYFGPAGRQAFGKNRDSINLLSKLDFNVRFFGNIGAWSGRVASVSGTEDPFPRWTGVLI